MKISETDVLNDLLRDKRSPNTKRAYRKDLNDFFRKMFMQDPTPEMVGLFLGMDRHDALQLVARYKGILIDLELAEATVNRRLSALRSLVSYARRAGQCTWGLEDISGEKVIAYRDTSGVDLENFQKMLAIPDRQTQQGKRDYAILALFWETALRRGELNGCDVGDLDLGITVPLGSGERSRHPEGAGHSGRCECDRTGGLAIDSESLRG